MHFINLSRLKCVYFVYVFLCFGRKNHIVTKPIESHRLLYQKNLYPRLFPSMSWWVKCFPRRICYSMGLCWTIFILLVLKTNWLIACHASLLSLTHPCECIIILWLRVYVLFINCFVKKRNFAGAIKIQPSVCENEMINGCLVSHGHLKL